MRVLRLSALALWLAVCFVPAWVFAYLKKYRLRDAVVRLCYRGIARIIGLKVSVRGRPSARRPLLVVSNHISYLDIVVLGSVYPFRFVPKSEVSRWPGIATLSNVSGSVYIERTAASLPEAMERLRGALQEGAVLCLFPESTTGNGMELLPFKSSLFQVAEASAGQEEILVQPVAVAYTRIRNLPIDSGQMHTIAWYGDMDLVPHLWEFLKLGGVSASVEFLSVSSLSAKGGRKPLAEYCRQMVGDAIRQAKSLQYID